MHSLQKRFQDFIQSNRLLKKDDRVLVAVSGGVDSMVLADLFSRGDIEFALAHCNFGLRGDESDEDEAFVLEWAEKKGINCFVKSFDLEGSIQVEARNARYLWFKELLLENEMSKVSTAHHLNDSLESLMINLSRGTGIKGLTGVPIINEKVVRPLLFATKTDIYNYAMDEGLEWREDASNQKDDYARNQIRNHVIPAFEKVSPSILKTFDATLERLSYAGEIVEERVEMIKSKHLSADNGGWKLDLSWMSQPSDELILAEILAEFGLNYKTAKEVYRARGKSGKSFPANNWLITMDRSEIFIDSDTRDPVTVVISKFGDFTIGNRKLTVEESSRAVVKFGLENEVYLSGDHLKFPLTVRNWQEGDRFQPLGMRGSKKISDFLIDEKLPQAKKNDVLVVVSNNEICWVVGFRISEGFKIDDQTDKIIKISIS